jgi:4-hydroxyproline epimerase
MKSLNVIDSHTGGEPTRVILEDQIALEGSTMEERRDNFSAMHDLQRGILLEPRGSYVWVGALLAPPANEGSDLGVIFFNQVGCLGMCGHGTIGVVETLRHLGRLTSESVRLDTPVGTVSATITPDGWVAFENVPSFATQLDVELEVPQVGRVVGDVAYGGNWFFIVRYPKFEINLAAAVRLTDVCWRIRKELGRNHITGKDGAEIDHVELFGTPPNDQADSINFVQCPGGAYDRSPCGTGTSAKLATLFARGELQADTEYRQMSVTGSVFRGWAKPQAQDILPTIAGQAHVTAVSTLFFDPCDPVRWGIQG